MAEKGWTTQTSAAAGIAAGAGAAQLGLGYGLGVIAWPVTAAEAESVWLGSLGWATWITASATVLGAVIAGRLRPDQPGRWRALWRLLLAAAAALGALVSVALVALPARSAVRIDTFSPQLVAGGYALAGLLAGLVVAFWAVSSVPVAANLIGTAIWLWALAVAGVMAELATGRDYATYLTSWQFAESVSPIRYGGIYWPSALLTLVAAFVIGFAASWASARRGALGLGTAISGAVGPLLVAFSFLLLAPQLTAAMGPLQSAYLIAPYAVLTGLGGSALTVTLERSRRARAARTTPDPRSADPATHRPGTETSAPDRSGPAADPAPTDLTATGPAKATDRTETSKPLPPAASPAKATGRTETSKPPPAAASPAKATGRTETGKPPPAPANPAKATGRATPLGKPSTGRKRADQPEGGSLLGLTGTPGETGGDPEIAEAVRTPRSPAKRPAPPQPTITPPPAEPTIARINPSNPDKDGR